jgi:hypothetical protein
MGEVCSTHGKLRNEYKILIGKPEGKRLLGSRMRNWEVILG